MPTIVASFLVLMILPATVSAADTAPNFQKAAACLDGRQADWFAWTHAKRGNGTSCVSCHTNLPFALARPAIHRLLKTDKLSTAEKQLLANVKTRVAHWKDNSLFYDFNDAKKRQSRGTEAVLNALILASYDSHARRTSMSKPTKRAFEILWSLQRDGRWEWLDFGTGYEPLESPNAQYVGAALAAVAVDKAPGDYRKSAAIQPHLKSLKSYLKSQYASQTLHNRLFALWAGRVLGGGILTDGQRAEIIKTVLGKQQSDGGFVLSALGNTDWKIHGKRSDGYATGLVLHVAKLAGVKKSHPRIQKSLRWLRTHQKNGVWVGYSVNKKRDPATRVGKFMTDAATAFGVLGLSAYHAD